MSGQRKVLVVGGGIAGLTLAVALRRQDIAVDVVELATQWNILGVGISLTGPTLRALKSIGLIDQCVEAAFGFDRIVFADAGGHPVGSLNMPRLCGPDYPATVAIGRPALHDVLIRAAQALGASITLGATVAALEQTADAVEVTFSNGPRAPYDFVVGCDGIRSTVRDLVFDDVPEANFTGLAVWRATMPRPKASTACRCSTGRTPRPASIRIRATRCSCSWCSRSRTTSGCRRTRCVVLQEQLRDFDGEVMSYVRDHVTDPAKIDYRPMNAFCCRRRGTAAALS